MAKHIPTPLQFLNEIKGENGLLMYSEPNGLCIDYGTNESQNLSSFNQIKFRLKI